MNGGDSNSDSNDNIVDGVDNNIFISIKSSNSY